MAPNKTVSAGRLWANLRPLEPPSRPLGMDDDALRALGLFDFVHLRFPFPVSLHRDLLAEFIFYFRNKIKKSEVRGAIIRANKPSFREALGIQPRNTSRPQPNVSLFALSFTASKFMDAYILPVHARTNVLGTRKKPSLVDIAMRDIGDNLAFKEDWTKLILDVAKKEVLYLMVEGKNDTISWDCFYAAYWLRLMWVQKQGFFPGDVVLQASGCANGAIVSMECGVAPPEVEQPRDSLGHLSICDGGTGNMDAQQEEDVGNGDSPRLSAGDAAQVLEELRKISTASPHANIAGKAAESPGVSLSPTSISIAQMMLAFSNSEHAQAEAAETDFLSLNNDNIVATRNPKRKIVDGSCGEIMSKKREWNKVIKTRDSGPSSSLEHTEMQNDMEKHAPSKSPVDEMVIGLKTYRTCLEGWDATKSSAHMSRIKQTVEKTVQQYMDNAATSFDSNNLPPDSKKLDRTPGAQLQLPESACSRTKYAFLQIVADLKNLQTLANAQEFNRHVFLKVTMLLDGWETFFSSHFTEGIKQMVTKLKVLKKELDNSGQYLQRTMEDLSERTKRVGEMLEEAVLVRKQITSSVTDVEHMKHDGDKSQESINTLKTSHTKNIKELEEKIKELEGKLTEERTSLGLLESLEARNADFFAKVAAVREAITESSSSFEDVVANGEALRNELQKRRQVMEEDRGLPAPLQAMRSLIAAYPIKE